MVHVSQRQALCRLNKSKGFSAFGDFEIKKKSVFGSPACLGCLTSAAPWPNRGQRFVSSLGNLQLKRCLPNCLSFHRSGDFGCVRSLEVLTMAGSIFPWVSVLPEVE
jgi:hypothetical protein